jgi:hypothetical protein
LGQFPEIEPKGVRCPATFDGTSTDNQDSDTIDASCFTPDDKVAIQVWFGSYVFTEKSGKTASGPTFRLLKIWRLQVKERRRSKKVKIAEEGRRLKKEEG